MQRQSKEPLKGAHWPFGLMCAISCMDTAACAIAMREAINNSAFSGCAIISCQYGTLVETLAGGLGLLISAVLIVRFLPTFLLFPVAGVIADRYVYLLYLSCLLSCASCLAKLQAKCFLKLQGKASFAAVNSSICTNCRFDRPKVMLCSAAVNIFVVLGLALIKRPSDIW